MMDKKIIEAYDTFLNTTKFKNDAIEKMNDTNNSKSLYSEMIKICNNEITLCEEILNKLTDEEWVELKLRYE